MLNLLLKSIVNKENLYIQSNASLKDMINLMNINRKGVIVVLEGERPMGILTERDIVEILYKGINLDERVDKYARKNLVSTSGNRTVGYALHLTIDNKIRRVVVTDEADNFLGIVTQQDLLKYLEEDFYRLTIKVKHILEKTGYLISASPDDSINDVLKKMIEHKISAVPIVKDKIAIGIITEKDILRLASESVPLKNIVGEYMSSPIDSASMNTPLVEVVEIMNYKNIRRILVVDKEGLALNIVTIRDVVENLEEDYSKFLEKKLKYAKEILDLLPEMLIEVTDTGRDHLIVWANEKVISKFGREILDKPVTNFLPRQYWDKVYLTLRKLNKIENIKFKKDNKIYELSGFFVKTAGRTEKGRFQLIMRDITEDVRLSTIDSLTNIYNKRFINGFLLKEVERSRRLNKHFSIVICDMDDFKRINDTYGHLSGDMVLKSFSQLIKSSIRNIDVAGRYGGDEFVIILPETACEDACNIIDRLRFKIEGMDIPVLNSATVHITASFGISTFPVDGMSSDDLLIVSDERLYKAKSFGKNKIAYT